MTVDVVDSKGVFYKDQGKCLQVDTILRLVLLNPCFVEFAFRNTLHPKPVVSGVFRPTPVKERVSSDRGWTQFLIWKFLIWCWRPRIHFPSSGRKDRCLHIGDYPGGPLRPGPRVYMTAYYVVFSYVGPNRRLSTLFPRFLILEFISTNKILLKAVVIHNSFVFKFQLKF